MLLYDRLLNRVDDCVAAGTLASDAVQSSQDYGVCFSTGQFPLLSLVH